MKRITTILILAMASALAVYSQGEPPVYKIERSVIATGGGTTSSDLYSITGTIGQEAAGKQAFDESHVAYVGFWHPEFAPTAAMVGINGRVIDANGRGVPGARLLLMDISGNTASSITGTFGYYRFENVEVGQSYILAVTAKRLQFAQPSIIFDLTDEITGLDFQALP